MTDQVQKIMEQADANLIVHKICNTATVKVMTGLELERDMLRRSLVIPGAEEFTPHLLVDMLGSIAATLVFDILREEKKAQAVFSLLAERLKKVADTSFAEAGYEIERAVVLREKDQ